MGYVNNAPIKQVWLPIDYVWLGEKLVDGSPFKDFAEAYKKQYGIDLHDIFSLNIKNGSYSLNSKVDLVGAYLVGRLNDTISTKYAENQAIRQILDVDQNESTRRFAVIAVGDLTNFANGIDLGLPPKGTEINSIDDCIVSVYEI